MVGGEGVAASPSIAGNSSFPPSFSASSSSTPLPVSQPSHQVIGSSTPAAAVTPTASMSAQFGDSQQNPQLQVLSPQPVNMTGAQSLQQQTGVLLQQNQQQSTNPGQVNYQLPSTPGQQHLGQKQQQGSLPRPQQQQHGQYVQNQQFASSAQSPSSMQGAQPLARPSLSSSPSLSQRPLQLSQTGVRSGGPTSQQQMMMPQTGISNAAMSGESFSFPSLTNDFSQHPSELLGTTPSLIPEQPVALEYGVTREVNVFREENESIVEDVQDEQFSHHIEADSQPVGSEEPFDDMVVLEDGIVTVPAASGLIVEDSGGAIPFDTATESLLIPEVPAPAEDVHIQQPNGPTDENLEGTASDIKQPGSFTVVSEVSGEGAGGDEPVGEDKASKPLLDSLLEPSAVKDNHLPNEITSDEIHDKELATEIATEKNNDSKPPVEEVPSGEEKELLYVTTEDKQNLVDSDSMKGDSLKAEKPDLSIQESQLLTDSVTPEKPQVDSELEQTQHAEEEVTDPELPRQEAEALIGRRVVKTFGKQDFLGEITGYDAEAKWFKVVYEDLDEEDLEWVEVKSLLLSADATKLPIRPKSVKKKREHAGDNEDGDERTPKKAKKSAAGTPSDQKTPVSGKKKAKSKKGTPGTKVKGSKSTSTKKPSSGKKSKQTKGKSPGNKGKQEDADIKSYKTPSKSQKTKEKDGKKSTARKSVTSGKGGKSTKQTGKKGVKGSQLKSKSQKQKSGTKRMVDMDETQVSLGKRLKLVAAGNTEDATELHSPRGNSSSEGKLFELGGRESLVGRLIRKKFGGKFYNGKVESFDKKSTYYKVVYEDGDEEDLEWHELEPVLVSEEDNDKPAKNTPGKSTSHKKKAPASEAKSKGKNKAQTGSR